MKLIDIIKSKEALDRLFTERLPIKVSFNLRKSLRKLNTILKDFEDTRVSLIEKLGEIDASNGNYIVNKENIPEFNKEMDSLLESDIETEFNKISVNDLGDIKISPLDLEVLSYLFTEE